MRPELWSKSELNCVLQHYQETGIIPSFLFSLYAVPDYDLSRIKEIKERMRFDEDKTFQPTIQNTGLTMSQIISKVRKAVGPALAALPLLALGSSMTHVKIPDGFSSCASYQNYIISSGSATQYWAEEYGYFAYLSRGGYTYDFFMVNRGSVSLPKDNTGISYYSDDRYRFNFCVDSGFSSHPLYCYSFTSTTNPYGYPDQQDWYQAHHGFYLDREARVDFIHNVYPTPLWHITWINFQPNVPQCNYW